MSWQVQEAVAQVLQAVIIAVQAKGLEVVLQEIMESLLQEVMQGKAWVATDAQKTPMARAGFTMGWELVTEKT